MYVLLAFISLPILQVQEGQDDRWQQREIFPIFTQNDTDYVESFPNLEPNTRYQFRIMASYRTRPYPLYVWPKEQNQFIFKTMGEHDILASPNPIFLHVKGIKFLKKRILQGGYDRLFLFIDLLDNAAEYLSMFFHSRK